MEASFIVLLIVVVFLLLLDIKVSTIRENGSPDIMIKNSDDVRSIFPIDPGRPALASQYLNVRLCVQTH